MLFVQDSAPSYRGEDLQDSGAIELLAIRLWDGGNHCHAFTNLYKLVLVMCYQGPEVGAYLAWGIGHGTDDLRRRKDPATDLRYSRSSENADEQLVI